MAVNFKFSDKAKAIIAAIAPTLGTAIGGPFGTLAGATIAAAIGGGDPKAAEAAILGQDPATLLALKKADQDFTIQLEQLGIERDKLAYADVADARSMAKVDMRPQIVIGGCFLTGYFAIMGAIGVGAIQLTGTAAQVFPILIGVLTAAVPQILQFFFGSSVGSKEKTQILGQVSVQ